MAKIDVIMPQMGESISEGTLSRWMKKVGDSVQRDEPIFEISTDKVDAEIPAPEGGTLAEILVQEGQTVAVQTVVARIETEVTAAQASARVVATVPPAAAAPEPVAPVPAPTPKPVVAAVPPPPPPQSRPAVEPPAPPRASRPAPPSPVGNGAESVEERLRQRSTPLVRKMAAEHNLDLSSVAGTGFGGRVTRADIEGFLHGGGAGSQPGGASAQPVAAPPSGRPAVQPSSGPAAPLPCSPAVEPWPGDRVEPWSRIRKLTADHMVMSRRVSAHVNSLFEIDYTRVGQIRAAKKADYAVRGVNLTYLAFIVKAVADNLRKHPVVNTAVSGDNTIYRRDVNIGIAVALDWGLIVPVVHHADGLALLGIARAIQDLADRARNKKLSPDDVQHGTFTITNPGVFGSFAGTPIINQPQAAILAVGAIEKRPAVVKAPDGTESLGIRTTGMITMAYDHRIVDGADADRFLSDVKQMLQNFPDSDS